MGKKSMPKYTIKDEFIHEIRQRILLTESNVQSIKEAIQFIRKDRNLRFLFWLWHCILFQKADEYNNKMKSSPLPNQPIGITSKLSGLFPAVVILSGYHSILSIYNKMHHMPEQIINDTLTTVEEYMNIFRDEKGYHGLSLFHLNRLLQHFRAELFRIGRLEYHMITFKNPIIVYRNKFDCQEIALSQSGIRYRSDGHVDGTNNIYADDKHTWTSSFIETKKYIKGHPISTNGYARSHLISLIKNDWSCVLKEGDHVLGIHIPRKGQFTKELCQDSIYQAKNFFHHYFPDKNFRAFVCVSWMLDPQLQSLLDASSNIVRFQKMFNLYPVLSMDHTIYKFVYRCKPCKVEDLPENTTLQRKIKNYMLSGGLMHTGGGFITFK